MAVYVYTANGKNGNGEAVIRGMITADTPRQARDQLRARGLSIQNVVEQSPGRQDRWWTPYLVRRQGFKVTGFLQELSTLLRAGIPLVESLDTITRQHTDRFRRSILLLRDHVAAGGSLAEAMGLQPDLYDPLCLNIVDVGENAGNLDVALARLVAFRRRTEGLKNRVVMALMYPAIVLAVALTVSVFVMTYVLPNLLRVLVESGKPLPFATVVIKGMSDFLVGWWWALILGVAVVTALLAVFLRTNAGRMKWHRLQLRLPLLGDLVRKQAVARMAIVMATLLKSGLVFVRSLQIAQRTVRNLVLREALETCERAVCAGQDISVALESTLAFPPLVIQIFAVGQASGNLEEMLEDLANDYDTQVDITLSRLTAVLEPIMLIMLAVAVGFIAFSTILPILEAGDVL